MLSLKKEYDLIIIDTSSESLLDYTREILNISNSAIFISGANLLEIKKSIRLLEIYQKEWNIDKDMFNIIFNKFSKNSVDDDVLKELFRNYNILGKVRLNEYYDVAINKNDLDCKRIEDDIIKINEKFNKTKKQLKIKKIKKKRRVYGS